MPLPFSQLCDLLSFLESLSRRDPPLLPAIRKHKYDEAIQQWFRNVSSKSLDIDAVALLSALFPEKRTDRVYGVQLKSLTKLLKRCLCLGKDRLGILDQWEKPGRGSLCDCVERALRQAEFPQQPSKNQVTLEQVDDVLATIAGKSRFSAPKVRQREIERRRQVEDDQEVLSLLGNIYQRMQSREAKWFTRLILKDYGCLDLAENVVYHHLDTRLPVAMQMYDNFEAAIRELGNLSSSQMADVGQRALTQRCADDSNLLPPRIGVKLGPPKWVKAKGGIKHAVSVIKGRTMSIERKHDGEYCQIHVDLSKGDDCIQIFSKSAKDSTMDRIGVHKAIKDSLHTGKTGCKFSRKCILEGELLVWSDRTGKILEFHKIRKHVSRSGSFLGTDLDSQQHPWERLMIMFYDVLLIDDKPVLHQPYRQRRELLEELATRIKGRADLVWQSHVDFSTPKGPKRLKKALAHAFVHRWEGLVLKPSDEPYFNTGKPVQGKYPSRWIKLKKDCIKGLGDTADFAVIGAGYDVTEAAKYEGLNIRWTHFYVGCLVNKQAVLHKDEKPQFFIFEKISDCIKKEDLKTLTENGYLRAVDPKSLEASELFDIQYASGLSPMLTMFKRPFVFDIAGSGFDKSPNREIFTLRFPRVMKIRWDRDWTEAVSLNELQEMAMEARTTPSGDLSQEIVQWIAKLDQLDRGAKGQMTSWDSSGDEKEHCNFENDEVTSKPKASRHARDSAAPPLVRMDTGEMREPERRLRNGEVVERPVSKLSIESLTSDGFLQTPPKSSPLSSRKDPQSARQEQRVSIAASSGRSKKRAVDFVGLEEAAGWPEKPEVGVEQPSKGNIKPSSSVRPAAHKQPLSEISNSARRAFRPQIAEAYQQQHTAVPGLSLERNIAFGAEIKSLRGQGKRRRLMEPSSPSIETTASSSTILSTAPRTIYHQPKPPSPKCPSKDQCKPSSFLTPPSTDQPRRIPKLPTLQECDVMVAPLTTENRHYLDRLIRSSTISPIPFPEASLPRQLVGERDSKVKANTITLLLDTDDTVTTGRQIWSLLPHLSHCHPRSVTAWDWRILSLMDKQETGEGDEKRRLMTDWFYAKLSWVPGSGTSGAVEVEWRDGEISRVLREEFEHVGD